MIPDSRFVLRSLGLFIGLTRHRNSVDMVRLLVISICLHSCIQSTSTSSRFSPRVSSPTPL